MPVLQHILEITGLFYACKWNGVKHSVLGATRGSPVKAGRLQVAYRGSVRLRGRRSRQHSRLRMHGIAVRGALDWPLPARSMMHMSTSATQHTGSVPPHLRRGLSMMSTHTGGRTVHHALIKYKHSATRAVTLTPVMLTHGRVTLLRSARSRGFSRVDQADKR